MPAFLARDGWCLERHSASAASRTYKPVVGCKSLVVEHDKLIFDGNVACKITSIAKSLPKWRFTLSICLCGQAETPDEKVSNK
jgi:hypothetical protein